MPGMDGWDLIDTMRSDKELSRIPIVVVPAQGRPPIKGADRVCGSPIAARSFSASCASSAAKRARPPTVDLGGDAARLRSIRWAAPPYTSVQLFFGSASYAGNCGGREAETRLRGSPYPVSSTFFYYCMERPRGVPRSAHMRAVLSTSRRGADPMAEPWVSVDDVAAHLGVRKDSIYRWIESRGLPARKIGKLWKMKLSEVDAWVRARGVEEPGPVTPSSKGARRSGVKACRGQVVLVIDDEKLVRDTIGEFLEDEGYGVLFASDGAEALEVLASASPKPSLIILDLKMPNVDGLRFREQQALDPNLASVPVIVVTADRSANVSGAAVLRKPLHIAQLANAIEKVLEGT
jgi:excisionase family DNA binding protein